MRLHLMPRAIRDLQKLPPDLRGRIIEKLEWYCAQEYPQLFARKLANLGIGDYRFRIGDYRAVFTISADKLEVLRIGHRRDIYR